MTESLVTESSRRTARQLFVTGQVAAKSLRDPLSPSAGNPPGAPGKKPVLDPVRVPEELDLSSAREVNRGEWLGSAVLDHPSSLGGTWGRLAGRETDRNRVPGSRHLPALTVTFSALIFFLYLLLFGLALAGASWVTHLRPPPSEAQRVTDAVERAGRRQLAAGLPGAGVALLGLCLLGLWGGESGDGSRPILALAPLAGALVAVVVAFIASQRLIRVTGQLVGTRTTDRAASLSGLAALCATLASAAGAGALVSGVELLSSGRLTARMGLTAGWLAASSGTLLLVLCGRALSVAWGAAEEGSPESAGPLTATTLARLVGASFGAAVMRAAGLFGVVGYGQAALASLSRGVAEDLSSIAQYAQLLIPLGLLAATFGAFAFRSSEREPATWAWLRGSGVSLLILVAGCWALAGFLSDPALVRVLPACVSLLAVGAALALFATTLGPRGSLAGEGGSGAQPSPTTQTLGLVLLLCIPVATALTVPWLALEDSLPDSGMQAVILGATLALLPLVTVWQMAADALRAAELCQILATEGQPATHPAGLGDPLGSLPLAATTLIPLAAICSFDLLSAHIPHPEQGTPWVLGIGVLLGAFSVLQTTAANRSVARLGARDISRISISSDHFAAAPLSAGLDAARTASARRQWVWLSAILLPPTLLGALQQTSAAGQTPGLTLGYLLGVVAAAALVAIRLDAQAAGSARPFAGLSLPAALAVLGWAVSFLLTSST